MLNVTLSQEAPAEAVEPAHRVSGVANPGARTITRGGAELPADMWQRPDIDAVSALFAAPVLLLADACPGANRAHPAFARG